MDLAGVLSPEVTIVLVAAFAAARFARSVHIPWRMMMPALALIVVCSLAVPSPQS